MNCERSVASPPGSACQVPPGLLFDVHKVQSKLLISLETD